MLSEYVRRELGYRNEDVYYILGGGIGRWRYPQNNGYANVVPSLERAFAGVVLGLAVDGDYLLSIAKLRAARAIWARIATACGAPPAGRIEARSSRRVSQATTRLNSWLRSRS